MNGGGLSRPGGRPGAVGDKRRDRPGVGAGRRGYYDDDEDEYDDDFIDDDEPEEDWRRVLRQTTRYDPSRFRDDPFDDRNMVAGWRQVEAEEKRSQRLGRLEDELAEEEEERHRKEKAKRLQALKKQRRD